MHPLKVHGCHGTQGAHANAPSALHIISGITDQIAMNKVHKRTEIKWRLSEETGTELYEAPVLEKRGAMEIYGLRAKRGIFGLSRTDALEKTFAGAGHILSGVSTFRSIDLSDGISLQDAGMMLSGGLDIVSAVTEFLPPPASTVTGAMSGILSFLGVGPPPEPTNTEVIASIKKGQQEIKKEILEGQQKIVNTLTKEVRSGFIEQKTWMYYAFAYQKNFLTKQFEKIEELFKDTQEYQRELFSKELIREVRNDAIALLVDVQEKYDYILPHAQDNNLTESEALNLDQHAGIMETTFQTARAKQAFIDRCPQAFIEREASTDTNIKKRQICGVLLETYFQVEKFRQGHFKI